ncbi:MAG TPA: ATP-binding protein [Vicinamibacterales bacterium]|jgi:nitrogen fixation/metabolism regulation signal transduction histidine kinase|nr:ATP-binding protein [Vicinamibacterales bacterium]
MASATSRAHKVRWSLEQAVLGLTLLGGLPAAVALAWIVWGQNFTFEVRWTLAAVVLAVWVGSAVAAYQMVTRVLYLSANLLGALHEGDYSIRGTGAKPGSAADLVLKEINSLGDTLQRQRSVAVESTALLTSVMGAIDVAVFAFDMNERLVLANPAAERLLRKPAADIVGSEASALRLEKYLAGETPRLIERAFGPESGRLELRRSTFYRDGKPHQLLVFADLSRALREEQQLAWQRIVRVLSHEINNSLTPIKSIAHSIKRMISRIPDVPRAADIQDGLNLIETRSGALGRFLRQYAQLAKLPKPQERPIQILPLARRIAELENRLPIEVRARDDLQVDADPDQLEQLLINIVRNAVDATVDTGGKVWIDWKQADGFLQLTVEDEGPGLPDTSNLFVPFFTTKPQGSGIGLALSRQIAEAHGGTLALENRGEAKGCRATLRLPMD